MIFLHNEDRQFPSHIRRGAIKSWLEKVAQLNKRKVGTINYIFCSDKHLLSINRDYLNHDDYTDIITFDYCADEKKGTISGDIFISIDRVSENAKAFGVSKKDELSRVMVHGLLHLCGFKDKNPAQQKLMRKKENESLSLLLKQKK